MPVVLVRIDDRLVHGQVVEGWLKAIRATHIVVASDPVAADETQKALYLLAVPQGIQLSCLSIREAAEASPRGASSAVLRHSQSLRAAMTDGFDVDDEDDG